MTAYHDMHCHLDFFANGEDVAARARETGTLLFANTVSPESWREACKRFGCFDNVAIGFGMHPWWVGDAWSIDGILELLAEHNPHFIGEIGLDLGRRHLETADAQRQMFAHIANWAAEQGNKLISLHSVHASHKTIDVLEQTGAFEACACIFHWFTGPSDQLKRAVQAGCYFSFGQRALATGKGREYVKAIPPTQLLLETDYPPKQGDACTYDELNDQLTHVARIVAEIKGAETLDVIAETSARLLQS